MRKMIKIISLLTMLVLVTAFCLSACADKNENVAIGLILTEKSRLKNKRLMPAQSISPQF